MIDGALHSGAGGKVHDDEFRFRVSLVGLEPIPVRCDLLKAPSLSRSLDSDPGGRLQ